MHPKVVAIDMDGTLTESESPSGIPGPLRPGAREFLQMLNHLGYYTVLFTANSTAAAADWARRNEIADLLKDITNVKPRASVFLDDRAVHFTGDYGRALQDIKAMPDMTQASRGYAMEAERG